jgi:peptidoglycan DL-endopeptidase LytE
MNHVVIKGDTLLKIAAKFKTTPEAIMKLNPNIKDPSHIEAGWNLKIPIITKWNSKYGIYVVSAGDTLSYIARLFNTTVAAILKANPSIKNPDLIHPGDEINIPDKK